jgi:peptidoglycan hydrolase-like protein with peptidoglycan-binding domain
MGSKGEEVRELQILLKKLGFDCKGTDGVFGANTKKAVAGL